MMAIVALRLAIYVGAALVAVIGGAVLAIFEHGTQACTLVIVCIAVCMAVKPDAEAVATYSEFIKQRQDEDRRAGR